MNRLAAWILAGTVLAGVPIPALAQETVEVAGISATRVVIAPPQDEISAIIREGLSTAYYALDRESPGYAGAQKLYYFYGQRGFQPLWLERSESGEIAFSPAAEKIMGVFRAAEREGLRPSDYLTEALDLAAAGEDPARLAGLETAFSAITMRYADDAFGGRFDPRSVSSLIDLAPRNVDQNALLLELAQSETPEQVLLDLSPRHPEFVRLREALHRMLDGEVQQTIAIADGPLLRAGMSDPRVPLIRQRLGLGAGVEGETIYDEALVAAVTEFQNGLGMLADGVAGPATIAALNGGAATSREDILANMERWRWMPEDMGDFHVFVNIPEYRLVIAKHGQDVYTTRVVVGKPSNRTPVFSDEIEHIVVNPYWNVPSSIANNEIAPQLRANPFYIEGQNMELLYEGEAINAAAIDWTRTPINLFRIRQRPGPGNALGQVKFLFPNSHDVYLHDTPSKSLFSRSSRAFSHGCVRVENPMEFAGALLQLEPSLTRASLESEVGGSETWNNLEHHVPVHLAYFTLRADADGTIRSFGDVYGYNQTLKDMMAQ